MVTGDGNGLAGRQADSTGRGSGGGQTPGRRTTESREETMEGGAMEETGEARADQLEEGARERTGGNRSRRRVSRGAARRQWR